VSRTIYASPRFNLFTALAVLVGAWLIEAFVDLVAGVAYNLSLTLGLTVWNGGSPHFLALATIVSKSLACVLAAAVVLGRARESWRSLGRAGFAPWILFAPFILIVAGATVLLSEIDNLLRALTPFDGLGGVNWAPGLGDLLNGSWTGPLLAVVIGPVTEEIIFRGLVLRGLLGRYRPGTAIVISALLFAFMHMNPAQFPIALALGLVLGWVFVRTRSLGLCMLGHALNNGMSYATDFFPYQIDGFNRVPEGGVVNIFQPWWFDTIGVALFAAGVWWIHRLAPAAAPWSVPPVPEVPPLPPPVLAFTSDADASCQPPPLDGSSALMSGELAQLVTALAQRARAASLVLATAPTAKKDAALQELARLIDASHESLLAANARDLASPEAATLTAAARDRLTLDAARLEHLATSVRAVTALPDPVGDLLEEINRPNGLRIRKLRVPIGVIGIIYEARPNVTVDCAILCLKSGNASILRGGKECFHTNTALAALIQQALVFAGLPVDAVQLVPTTDRAALITLLKLDTLIHCIIPRGGESLIRYVAANSTIPVIKHYKGVCFVYADAAADLAMAEAITVNAKASKPSVCNAAEQLLVHRDIAETFLPAVARALVAKNVQLRCDPASAAILDRAAVATTPATAEDFTTEFLDYVIAVRVVDSLDTAIATINRDSSNHSDAIVTRDEAAARRFLAEVDSATVYWNASTRFTDGFEFGYGAEIGISTDRLHARGPMGLRELCTHKFVIEGTGQVRE
jgi:glutamate-5-semialdehyde dehydrogenase